ncbi:hypothetical protein PV326_009178 [Microctonus aethiopoides]|nr:hypothetical protein PV326_009178 [Microctonus aethiopoides]
MVVDMELEEAKKEVLELMKEKDQIEAKLQELNVILNNNRVGMEDTLVDSEGYPRADIDVYQNDHKSIMKKIENGLAKVHAISGCNNEEPSVANRVSDSSDTSIDDEIHTEPFLRVNLVSPGSPAEQAGIYENDLIMEFGSINSQNFKVLKDIGELVEQSRYKPINVKVKRLDKRVILTLIPRPWSGRGVKYYPVRTSSMFTTDEELKILNTINSSSAEEFNKYEIKEKDLSKLLLYREKNGKFDTFDDLLLTQNISPFMKLCKSILSGEKSVRKTKTPGAPKSLISPSINDDTKKKIKTTMGFHIFGNQISWALIDENDNLSSWNSKQFENPSRSTLVPLINTIIEITSEFPHVDAYVMESDPYSSLSKLKTAAFSFYLQRQQVIAALIAVLGMRSQLEEKQIQTINNFYMLQARASARRYNLAVGSETISAESVVANILTPSSNENNKSLLSINPDILAQYSSYSHEIREQLNSVLLVTLTFIDIIRNR